MKLDSDQQENLKSFISGIIPDYSEKDFDSDKFLEFLFALYDQASSLDDFSDTCQRELVDFFGDNTESFVTEIINHISLNIDEVNLETQASKVSQHKRNDEENESIPSDLDVEGLDDIIPDDEEDDNDRNYRRDRNRDSKSEKSQTDSNTQPIRQNKEERKEKFDRKAPKDIKKQTAPPQIKPPPQQFPPQQMGFPPGPGPTNPWGPTPTPGMTPGMNPYQYMYPMGPMGYMPPGYPPMYPYDMMYPPHKMPEGKPSGDYDPLNAQMMKGPVDVKPPMTKPPGDQSGKKRFNKPPLDEHGEGGPSKVQVSDKDGKKTPKPVTPSEGANPKTTIYVKNIPDYYNNVDALNKQFKRFGPIVNIKVDLKSKSSTIEFVKPKHAKNALSNKQPLFGNKEILVTGDPNMTLEDEANEQKLEQKLLDKLKMLIEVKKYAAEKNKPTILQKINDIKQAQKTKEVPDSLKPLLDYEHFDLNIDFTQMIEEVPENLLENKNLLHARLEKIGKLENYKLNPKTRVADFKYFNLAESRKAEEELSKEFKIKYMSDKVHEMIHKIQEFEDKIFGGTNGTS